MSVPPPEVVFAFAPKNGYFFEYKDIRKWNNIPKGFLDLLEGRKEDKVKKTLSVAFASDGVWVCIYENEKGEAKYDGEHLPSMLQAWLDGKGDDNAYLPKVQIQSVLIVFGARAEKAFASATSIGGSRHHFWQGITGRAEYTLQRRIASYQRSRNIYHSVWKVSFGSDDDEYIVYQSSEKDKSGSSWLWNAHYVSLRDLILSKGVCRGYTCVLNPFIKGEYFLVRDDGTAEWNVNASYHQQVKILTEKILQDQSLRGSTTLAQAPKRPAEEDPQADGENKRIKIEK